MSTKKIHLLTVVGTRPEIIRLSSIINRLNDSKSIKHTLVHTGQNYDYNLNEVFFKDLNISKPDIFLGAASDSPSKTIGNILIKIDSVLDDLQPDAVLILGDTNSCLSAIAAKKKKIPIFHYEAGNRCFDQRVPEETNRKIVDHIADINLTYSSIARDYLLKEGLHPDRTIKIGSPMFEVLNSQKKAISDSKILTKLKLNSGKYFLISCHREENVDNKKNFRLLIESLNELAIKYKMSIIFPIHPRTKKIYDKSGLKADKLVKFVDPLGFNDYNKLQIESFVVLSDSGTIFEESSILNFRALNIRESHERPEAIEETSVVVTGLKIERILQGISILENQTTGIKRNINLVSDYNISNVSIKIERIILSHIDFVNRVVWQKEY
ncbi:UDP-N-acetylglucosamine 2-epimerase (non-hydrolyzing) [Flavobacteriaceae bacterium]|jgi:UDP-N-acetyl-L-fucosamine synthase|nr:UDP-N-acetylglucosamine 2-epimerase (non-hydrolyzing) [Flavobacteriaceae bacterium]